MKKLVVFSLAGVLAACAQMQWVNRGNSYANFYADQQTCEIQARAQYPDVVVAPPPPQPPKYRTECYRLGNSIDCTSKPVAQVDTSALQELAARPGTQLSRSIFEGNCLRAKGWQREKVNK
jgi:hypothetical protein